MSTLRSRRPSGSRRWGALQLPAVFVTVARCVRYSRPLCSLQLPAVFVTEPLRSEST